MREGVVDGGSVEEKGGGGGGLNPSLLFFPQLPQMRDVTPREMPPHVPVTNA